MTNILKKIIFYLFLILAILGFLLIYLSLGGQRNYYYYYYSSRTEYSIYDLLIGTLMLMPLFVYYLFKGKLFKNNTKEDNLKTYLPLNKIDNVSLIEKKAKDIFLVYIYNDTKNKVSTKEIIIEPNKSYVFQVRNDEIIKLSNGVEFYVEEMENLTVIDKKSQLKGIGHEYLDQYLIPKNIDFAFVIDYPFLGDLNYEIEGY
jgi:hypothetical protein